MLVFGLESRNTAKGRAQTAIVDIPEVEIVCLDQVEAFAAIRRSRKVPPILWSSGERLFLTASQVRRCGHRIDESCDVCCAEANASTRSCGNSLAV